MPGSDPDETQNTHATIADVEDDPPTTSPDPKMPSVAPPPGPSASRLSVPPSEPRASRGSLSNLDSQIEAPARLQMIVALILDHPEPFADNWIYVHSPGQQVGRIQNFRAWSPELVPEDGKSSIGMEYFCNVGSELWTMSDARLIELAKRELAELGLL